MDTFAAIADERRTLADELESLSAEQWDTPSLCKAWTVRQVLGHLVMPLTVAGPKFLVGLLTSGFNFDKANVKLSNAVAEKSPDELLALLRLHAEHRFTPPGFGPEAPLTDVLVHGMDIRRALGRAHAFDGERQRAVLDFIGGGSRGFVPKSRVAGLEFEAADLDWSRGEGDVVRGAAEALMMAIAGRSAALADLEGPGVDTLRSRLT